MTTIVGGVDIESTGLDFTSGHKIIEIAITRYELETQKHIDSLEDALQSASQYRSEGAGGAWHFTGGSGDGTAAG